MEAPELDFDRAPPLEWEEGVEEYKDKSKDELWAILGLTYSSALPDFNQYIDPDMHDYWSDPDYMHKRRDTLHPLTPRWHQLVGIIKIIHQGFKGEPLMLMDEVGVGKTLQLVGAVVILTFFRDYYDKNGKFPGAFGKCSPPFYMRR
jgi:hypothetical protein